MNCPITRRDALKALGGLAGALVTPCAALAQRNVERPEAARGQAGLPTATYLSVSVHKPGGDHLDQEASVMLRNGREVVLRRTPPKVTYEASIEPGTYRIVVKADGYAGVDYAITVPRSGLALPVYLGKEGWPSFRMGQTIVPFEPKDDFVAIAFSGNPPIESRWQPLLQQMKRMGLVPYRDQVSYLVAGKTIAIFRNADPGKKIFAGAVEQPVAPDLIENVSQLFGKGNARIGMPIDIRPGHVKVLDNAYLIRFGSDRPSADVRSLACTNDAVAHLVSISPNTWLFEFNERNNYRKHLSAVQQLLTKSSDIIYAEPNLIVELQNHSCPDVGVAHSCSTTVASSGTNDPWSNCQTNLALQGVPDAWCFLDRTVGSASRRGSSDICIATVHAQGINQNHPDAADGSLLTYIKLCDECADVPEDPHGTAVYGIISATPDNEKGTSGIAPGVFHTAVMLKQPWTDSEQYAQTLLWLSGVDSPTTFSQPPLAKPAHIICASHGIADLPTARPIAQAFERLTQEGRKRSSDGTPLGTVLVYSAGDEPADISGTQALAADPNVIAVGDTLPPDGSGVEKRWPRSNYGDRLDLCAQGEDAPSLLADPTEILGGRCTPNVRGPGAFEFAGTSAACPMVAATAALMLTVKKNLAWGDVRDLLRQTARCIDPDGGNWQNKRSYWYGSGRLDVHEAVKAAHQVGG